MKGVRGERNGAACPGVIDVESKEVGDVGGLMVKREKEVRSGRNK